MNPAVDMDAIDPGFEDRLVASDAAVWRVARWLRGRGNHVTVRAFAIRPTAADRFDYTDAGDLEIVQRVEVKRRGFAFTGASDFPFETLMIDAAQKWDRANPKPFAYVILNDAMTVAAIIDGRTAPQWRRVTRVFKGRDKAFLECPVALASFVRLEES